MEAGLSFFVLRSERIKASLLKNVIDFDSQTMLKRKLGFGSVELSQRGLATFG